MKMSQARMIYFAKWILLVLPVVFLAWFMNRYAVNVIMREDFDLIAEFMDIKNTGHINWLKLVAFNNEHIILFPKIVIFLLAYISDYNNKVMIIAIWLTLVAIYYLIIRFTVEKKLQDFTFVDVLYSVIVGFCLFNISQYENLLWNFQLAWFMIELCVVAGLIVLNRYLDTNDKKYFYMAIILGLVASFSSLHGLAIWLCYVFVIALYQFVDRRFDRVIYCDIILVAIPIFALYFYNYRELMFLNGAKAKTLWQMSEYALSILGSVISILNFPVCKLFWGVAIVVFSLFLFCLLLKTNKIKQNILPLGLLAYGGIFVVMIGFGRANWNILYSRYMTYPLLFVVAVLAILRQFCSYKNFKGAICIICFCYLSCLCVFTEFYQRKELNDWSIVLNARVKFLKNYKKISDFGFKILNFPNSPKKDYCISLIEKVEQNKLTVFHE